MANGIPSPPPAPGGNFGPVGENQAIAEQAAPQQTGITDVDNPIVGAMETLQLFARSQEEAGNAELAQGLKQWLQQGVQLIAGAGAQAPPPPGPEEQAPPPQAPPPGPPAGPAGGRSPVGAGAGISPVI